MVTRGKSGIVKPKVFHIDYTSTEPHSVKEAFKHFVWHQAMLEEYDALMTNKTWNLVPKPLYQKIVGCKQVFKIKRNSDGSIARYKACLVAKGFHQSAYINYFETFSLVVKPITIRVLLTLAFHYGWVIRQVDINNAFLHGILTDSVYMEQLAGFERSGTSSELVSHLKKSLYELKQVPRAWYERLCHYLLSLGLLYLVLILLCQFDLLLVTAVIF